MRDHRYTEVWWLSGTKALANFGYADVGVLWRSNYDMPPDDFSKDMDRIWLQLQPLYLSLHAYVRGQLAKKYGKDVVPPNGPTPRSPPGQSLGPGMER